jgi:hypothetical protein
LHLSSISVCKILLRIFCSAGLVVMNYIPWKAFIFPSIRKDSHNRYSDLGWDLLFSRLKIHYFMSSPLKFLLRNMLLL